MNDLSDLVGETIDRFEYDDGEIRFYAGDVVWRYVAMGQCCSDSWIDDANELDAFPGKVLSAECVYLDLNTEDPKNPPDYINVLESYGYKIRTDRGWLDITLYNSSNGYYSGYLERRR